MHADIAPAMPLAELSARWQALCADSGSPEHFELTENGEVVVSPSPTNRHQGIAAIVAEQLRDQLGGRAFPELAVHAAHAGVRKPDVSWLPADRVQEALTEAPLLVVPPLVVEIWSPGNTKQEMALKSAGYLAAGATEVVHVQVKGAVRFQRADGFHAESVFELRLALSENLF